MNKTIINKRVIDHSRTERILKEIMSNVRKQGAAYMNYEAKKDESKDQAMYSAQYLKGFADKALEDLVAVAKDNTENFERLIKEARDIEKVNDAAPLDINNSAMRNAIVLMEAMGKEMDHITVEYIIKTFVGQNNALIMLHKLFEKYEVNIPEPYKKYFYDTDLIFNSLFDALLALTFGAKDILPYQKVQNEIVEVAVVLGVELTDADLEVGIPQDSIFLKNMRMAVGLPEEE